MGFNWTPWRSATPAHHWKSSRASLHQAEPQRVSGGVRVGTSAGFFVLIAGQLTSSFRDCVPIYQVSILRERLLKSHYPPVSESRGRGLMFPEVFPGSQKSTWLLQLMVGSRDSVSWGNDVGPTGLINSVILDR